MNAHLEKWGPFGRAWTLQKFAVEMIEPRYSLMDAWPLAWSESTNGPVNGEPILAPVSSTLSPKKAEADLEKYIEKWKGKLKGKIVLISEPINNIVEVGIEARVSPLHRCGTSGNGGCARAG